jgi:anaerobic selenocysteine-containing dehydrogenase
MSKLTRREFLVTSAAAAAASGMGVNAAAGPGAAGADSIKYPIEQGATCACCAGSASSRATKTCGTPTSRSSPN